MDYDITLKYVIIFDFFRNGFWQFYGYELIELIELLATNIPKLSNSIIKLRKLFIPERSLGLPTHGELHVTTRK